MPLLRQTRSACRILLLLVLAAAAGGAQAAGEKETLGLLYRVALLMDATVLDLNMLLGEEQDPAYITRLDGTLAKLAAAQEASTKALGSSGVAAADVQAIAAGVSGFLRSARANRDTLVDVGSPEGAVVDEMMLKRKETRKTLDVVYGDLEKRAGLSGSPLSEARALALLLQQVSALYVETASSAGGVSYRTLDSNEATIDTLARRFGKQLEVLLAKARDDESKARVRSISTKWRFIERSLLNYRENMVPYLVDRYTQVIVSDLMALAEMLEKK